MDDPLWDKLWYELIDLEIQVLIPLLVDDPLWATQIMALNVTTKKVLIPLLVDDPLWALFTINETTWDKAS